MARKPRRKFNLRKVPVSPETTLSTLASKIVLVTTLTGNADGAYRVMSVDGSWAWVAATAGEGPLTVGYAHSDYSITEIKEALEAGASISVGDKVNQEKANRLVRKVGVINALLGELNDGAPIKTRLNWLIPIGKSVNMFCYNEGGNLTTGSSLHMAGDMWVKDSS